MRHAASPEPRWPDVTVERVLSVAIQHLLLPTRAIVTVAAAVIAVGSGCGSGQPGSKPSSPTRSLLTPTTQIAGATVIGNERRPDQACAPEPATVDPGPPTRPAHNVAGVKPDVVQVPAEAQRIVVLAGDQLDALCRLGLQYRVAAAALPNDSVSQPSYLGKTVHGLPGVGTRRAPDLSAIAATQPDLILGSQELTPQLYPQLTAIAPTVFTAAAPGATWEDNLRGVGAATARNDAVETLINGFSQRATQIGATHDATHYQVSIVQLTTNTMRVYGSNNFPARVLTAVGVDRPTSQRFTDQAYIQSGITDADLAKEPDFSAVDADIIYVSCTSPAVAKRAATVLDSGPWRKLSANHDNRIFIVNDEVWQTGEGLIAARGIVDDLRWINAPIN